MDDDDADVDVDDVGDGEGTSSNGRRLSQEKEFLLIVVQPSTDGRESLMGFLLCVMASNWSTIWWWSYPNRTTKGLNIIISIDIIQKRVIQQRRRRKKQHQKMHAVKRDEPFCHLEEIEDEEDE